MASLADLKLRGRALIGDNGSDPAKLPEWLDQEKLKKARELFKRDLFGVFFNHLSGLSLLVYVKSILEPLLATKQSDTVSLLFRRYLSTLSHVHIWYKGDITNPDDPAGISIGQVRKIHKKVSDKLNENVKVGSPVALSQYDMMITQFAFIGLIVLRPEKFGISWTDDELDCVLHFWRVVGCLLGMDDEFNLFGRKDIKEMCQQIVESEMKESFTREKRISRAHEMSQGIVESVQPYIPLIRWEPFLKYLIKTVREPEKVELKTKHSLIYKSMSFTLQHAHKWCLTRSILNRLLIKAIKSAQERRSDIYRNLQQSKGQQERRASIISYN